MDEEREEWDGPWKEALDSLALVCELFWPDVPDEVDVDKGCASLEQELQKLTPDSNTGLLRVDKLFELVARPSGDPRFEAQMAKDVQLPWRMFKYGRRAGEHFNQAVGRFAILGDDDPEWRPASHREGVLGCEDVFAFRIAKLTDWRGRMGDLEAGANLFGLFLCAHLETMATRGDGAGRQEAKFRLLANLMRRTVADADFRRWYRLIDWIMKLPEDANRAVWHRLEELKEPKPMSYVPFAERYYGEIGLKQGISQSLREALEVRFPEDGPALAEAFKDEQNVERLKALLRHAVLAQSPDDFRTRAGMSS